MRNISDKICRENQNTLVFFSDISNFVTGYYAADSVCEQRIELN
jgi:hypothetical protein